MGIFKFGFGTKFSMKALRSNLFGRIGRRGKGVVERAVAFVLSARHPASGDMTVYAGTGGKSKQAKACTIRKGCKRDVSLSRSAHKKNRRESERKARIAIARAHMPNRHGYSFRTEAAADYAAAMNKIIARNGGWIPSHARQA